MAGTILCGVTDSAEGWEAAQMASALSARLGLRLVLAHAVEGVPRETHESLTARQRRTGTERALVKMARDAHVPGGTEVRIEFGDRASLLAQVAAEEGADLIVLGSRMRGFRGKFRCGLARELEATTPTPLLIAPPQTRKRSERRLAIG